MSCYLEDFVKYMRNYIRFQKSIHCLIVSTEGDFIVLKKKKK